jgi:hypothetical protein
MSGDWNNSSNFFYVLNVFKSYAVGEEKEPEIQR